MSTWAILVASIALTPCNGDPRSGSITVEKHLFKQINTSMPTCRKVEAGYHNGNGEVVKRGNKLISRVSTTDGKYVTETTTFCVEI